MRSRASLATGLKHWEIPTRYLHARRGDPKAVTAVIAAVAKSFTVEGLRPAPPGLPILRAFHAVQGEVARSWPVHRIGWR